VVDLCFGSTDLWVVPVAGMLTMRVVQPIETSLRPTVALVVGLAIRMYEGSKLLGRLSHVGPVLPGVRIHSVSK